MWPCSTDNASGEPSSAHTMANILLWTLPQGFPEGAAGPILRCKMTWAEGDPTDAEALSKAGVAHADAVILGAVDSKPPKEVRLP